MFNDVFLTPAWWMVVVAFVAGHVGGAVLAVLMGVVKAVHQDTQWHLANLQQNDENGNR